MSDHAAILEEARKALDSLRYAPPEAKYHHQARLALALNAIAEEAGLNHGAGHQGVALIDAANVLRQNGHNALATMALSAAREIAEPADPGPLSHERDCNLDNGDLP